MKRRLNELHSQWVLERRSGGNYTLKIANAPVEAVGGALFALLNPMDVPEEWVITHIYGDLYA